MTMGVVVDDSIGGISWDAAPSIGEIVEESVGTLFDSSAGIYHPAAMASPASAFGEGGVGGVAYEGEIGDLGNILEKAGDYYRRWREASKKRGTPPTMPGRKKPVAQGGAGDGLTTAIVLAAGLGVGYLLLR